MVSRGVALGRRAALATVVGNAAGVYVQVLLVAVGLGAVISRSALVFDLIRFAGAAYLVYLGVQAFRHRRALSTVLDAAGTVRPTRHLLREGFLVGIANPKAAVFFAAILPQFVNPGGAPAGFQMALLGLVFVRHRPGQSTAPGAWPRDRPGPGWPPPRVAWSCSAGPAGSR